MPEQMDVTPPAPGVAEVLAEVLAGWGLQAAPVRPLDASTNRWHVDAPGEPLLLRRYEASRSAETIGYEHALLAFLADRSWPVAVPLPTASGATVMEADGARWGLFPLLPGEPPPDESIFLQRRGALLALVHADLADWDGQVRRGRLDDFDAAVQPHGLPSFEALLARVHAVDPMRANMLAVLRARVEEQLEAYGYADLSPLPLWGACTSEHVLFDGNDVTGLIDFDESRADARAVDIAQSLLADTRSVGWRIIRWVAGYSAHANPPLTEQEADLVPVAMAALMLRRTAGALAAAQSAARLDEQALAVVDEALTVEANEADLRQVIRTAARLAPV